MNLPEFATWPELISFFEGVEDKPRVDWSMPAMACQAMGAEPLLAVPGSAAIACMQVSIILVDDILDDDPRGHHFTIGPGRAANLALALQALACRIIEQSADDHERQLAIIKSLNRLAYTTAFGQNLDVQNLEGEANYWRLVAAKSTPFYASAFEIGALLGGASTEQASSLHDFGTLVGESIQIQDDLMDSFETPANADWAQGRYSLPILYALTVDHPARARLQELRSQTNSPEALREAQQILISSGAVSYCVFHLIKRQQRAKRLLHDLSLPDPAPLLEYVNNQRQPIIQLLEASGTTFPPELQPVI